MKKKYCLVSLCVFGILLLSGCDEGESSLQRATYKDLAFVREQILAHHPGPVNQDDPLFTKKLEEAYDRAVAAVTNVRMSNDYWRIMNMFVESFGDEHLRVWKQKKAKKGSEKKVQQEKFVFDEIAPQIAWIRLPTFDPNDEQKRQIAEMYNMLFHLRDYKAIVFDLHGNTGGNNAWGNQILECLFTPSYVQQQMFELWQKISIEYRVSADNIDHIRKMAQGCAKNFGKDSELACGYREFGDIMQAALDRGDDLVKVPKGSYKPLLKDVKDPVKALIIVVIDRHCASAALDFVDVIKTLNHPTILFGETTSADTFYMDVRERKLPSGQGIVSFPIKVYRGRPRGNNEPYKPDIAYQGDFCDTSRVAEEVYRLITGQKQKV